jgi:hypothetical protein
VRATYQVDGSDVGRIVKTRVISEVDRYSSEIDRTYIGEASGGWYPPQERVAVGVTVASEKL